MDELYVLSCHDASHLGGPMGTEYTTFMFSRMFTTVEKAKEYAKAYMLKRYGEWPEWAKWTRTGKELWSCDARFVIWDIRKGKVDESL